MFEFFQLFRNANTKSPRIFQIGIHGGVIRQLTLVNGLRLRRRPLCSREIELFIVSSFEIWFFLVILSIYVRDVYYT